MNGRRGTRESTSLLFWNCQASVTGKKKTEPSVQSFLNFFCRLIIQLQQLQFQLQQQCRRENQQQQQCQ